MSRYKTKKGCLNANRKILGPGLMLQALQHGVNPDSSCKGEEPAVGSIVAAEARFDFASFPGSYQRPPLVQPVRQVFGMNYDFTTHALYFFGRETRVVAPSLVNKIVGAIRQVAPRQRWNRVEDDRTITGVPHSHAEVEKIMNAYRTQVHPDGELPMSGAERLTLDEKTALFFSVAKGTTEIYQLPDGRCVRRKDQNTLPETVKRIEFDRQEIKSREFDPAFVDGATVNDLDVQFIQTLADRFLHGLSVERYLQQIGVAEYAANGLRLRYRFEEQHSKVTQTGQHGVAAVVK